MCHTKEKKLFLDGLFVKFYLKHTHKKRSIIL